MNLSVLFFTLFFKLSIASTYKHVIMMHGLFGTAEEYYKVLQWLQTDHPGTNYTIINQFDLFQSLDPMWKQIEAIKSKVTRIMLENPKGVHLLGYSQGGLICRGLIESIPNHNVHNFISLSSPQGGQFGDTDFLKFFPYLVKKDAYIFFYTNEGQKFSVGNYWNDPHHQNLYLDSNNFLPVLNNEVKSNNSQMYRNRFLSLKNLVLIGGPHDGVIEPWQSSQFAQYDSNETVQAMEKQRWYKEDTFGLKTLHRTNRLHRYTVPDVEHLLWPLNHTVYKDYILPWLT